jgi:hypothetical protein
MRDMVIGSKILLDPIQGPSLVVSSIGDVFHQMFEEEVKKSNRGRGENRIRINWL